jgi:MSHA biogenesis protein MshK
LRGICIAAILLAGAATAAQPVEDPFRPPETAAPEPVSKPLQRPTLRLQSTLVSGERRTAVINGRAVTVGSRIGGGRIVDIDASRVRIRDAGGVYDLELPLAGMRRNNR